MSVREPLATVLVVDDVSANIGVLLDVLTLAGYRVLVAESGQGALEQLGYVRPDIIIMDVMMPGLDGFETCRRIRANPDWHDIPIIFMTALSDPVDRVKGFEAGAVDYVGKPIFCDEVVARIKTHLEIQSLQNSLKERNVLLAEEVRRRREAEAQLRQSLDSAVIVATSDAEVLFCSGLALRLLIHYFNHADPLTLPESLAMHLGLAAGKLPQEPIIVSLGEHELAAHVFAEQGRMDCFMLLLEERTPRAGALRALGLTDREAEVLFWIAQGKTNSDIAMIVCAAPNTIKKHAQNILAKLGVETRTAAARAALKLLGSAS